MRVFKALLVSAAVVCSCSSVLVADKANVLGATAREPAQYTFEDDVDGNAVFEYDTEFDLDTQSKEKMQRLHPRQRDDDREIHISPLLNEDTNDLSIKNWDSKIAAKGFQYGRGPAYVATKSVERGDILYSVPFDQIMSLASAKQGRIHLLLEANPTLPAAISLALHLLEEKFRGDSSPFASYIETLPSASAINTTAFYTQDEFERIKGSQLYRMTAGRIQAVRNFYDALLKPVTSIEAVNPPLFTEDQFTFENLHWALAIVWSHATQVGPADQDVVIAPAFDTISICLEPVDCDQHAAKIQVDARAQRLVLLAKKDYQPGEQVFVDLGLQTSQVLMLNHGLTRPIPSPQRDHMDLSIMLDANDTLVDIKTFLLNGMNMTMTDPYMLRYNANSFAMKTLQSLKIKLLKGDEIDKIKALQTAEEPAEAIVSLRNEFVAYRALVLACKNLLRQYPTTLEEDRAQLAQKHLLTQREEQMLYAVMMEKEILHQTIDLALDNWKNLIFSTHKNILGKDEDDQSSQE